MDHLAPDLMRHRWFKGRATRWDYGVTRRRVMADLAPTPDDRILEIGCGPGTWTRQIATQCGEMVVVDLSAKMIVEARKQVAGLPVHFIHSDFLEARPEGLFDKVVSVRAIEYIRDKERLAARIAAALAPGGKVVLITKSRYSVWRGRHRLVYPTWPGRGSGDSQGEALVQRGNAFQTFTSPADLARIFAPHGITPVSIKPVVLRPPIFSNGFDEVPLVPDFLAPPILGVLKPLLAAAGRLPSWLQFLPLFFSESYCITLRSNPKSKAVFTPS
jgi:SAM-dependent methyltransferase